MVMRDVSLTRFIKIGDRAWINKNLR